MAFKMSPDPMKIFVTSRFLEYALQLSVGKSLTPIFTLQYGIPGDTPSHHASPGQVTGTTSRVEITHPVALS